MLLKHIMNDRFLELINVSSEHRPTVDLLSTGAARLARIASVPLVVTLSGAFVASGTTIAVAILRKSV
jgi:hypothetical protein